MTFEIFYGVYIFISSGHKTQCKHITEISNFLTTALVYFQPQQSADIFIDLCVTTGS